MNIGISMGNFPLNGMFTGGILKSTREKMERKQECDNMVAFYENKISGLKNIEADSLEDISRKLELFHTYQDGIAAAKMEYNHQQMFHVLDEAREQGEKIAEAAEDTKPKTAEERRKEMIEEALRTEDEGGIMDVLEEIADMVEEPEKLNLSKEDMDYYRQKLQNTNGVSVDEIAKQKEMLSKLSMSAEDGMETQFHEQLIKKNGALGKESFDRDKMLDNCLSVYTSMQDEIRQRYAQGTREKWIADGDIMAGGSYRKLTEEEELAALDKTFNFYKYVINGYADYGH